MTNLSLNPYLKFLPTEPKADGFSGLRYLYPLRHKSSPLETTTSAEHQQIHCHLPLFKF